MNMKFVFECYSLTCRTIYQQPALNVMSFLLLFKIKHKKKLYAPMTMFKHTK